MVGDNLAKTILNKITIEYLNKSNYSLPTSSCMPSI